MLKNPVEEMRTFQAALKELVAVMKPDIVKDLYNLEFFIGLEGTFGSKHVSPRTLTSRFLGNLVCCDGIVTKCTSIKPKVVRSVHYCPATKRTMERRYTDLTSSDPFPSSASYPTKV
jgi:DNA replication licensing factor MCM3